MVNADIFYYIVDIYTLHSLSEIGEDFTRYKFCNAANKCAGTFCIKINIKWLYLPHVPLQTFGYLIRRRSESVL